MNPVLPLLLSLNGGYVDTAGFLALQGLFTAHVTGNFVTFGAAIVLGTSGAVAKLLALPTFCIVAILARLLHYRLPGLGLPALRTMLTLKLLLLIAGAALAIRLGPFASGDGWPALVTGMTLVAAMAIQNALHRVHLASAPPTTLMTGTTTQIMLDLADLLHGLPPEAKGAVRARVRRMSATVASFAAGCAAAALLYGLVQTWCFLAPPLLALLSLARAQEVPAKPALV
jgi:uncharacterized membrane protein YoaK (UPF0700 family)